MGRSDEEAWDALVDRYSQDVWDTVRMHGLDEAEAADMCVLAWYRLADRVVDLTDHADVGAWVCDVAAREAQRLIASRRRPLA